MLHNLNRGARRALLTALIPFCCLAPGLAASQNTYPTKAVRLVVPFAPGGVADTSARLIAEQLTKRLNQQVYVENKAGASGNIGSGFVANADPEAPRCCSGSTARWQSIPIFSRIFRLTP